MPHGSDVDHQLITSWSADDLAVYADRLIEDGDPRGDLIALDLNGGLGREWHRARFAAIEAWLGRDLAEKAAPFLRYGFLEDVGDDDLSAELLASPAGDYVRTFRSQNDVKTVQESIERLVSRPRPWLAELTIHLWSDPITNLPRIDPELADQLVAATPRLTTLDLSGKIVLERFAHPAVRTVKLSGADALREVAFPAATELDLAFHRVHRPDRSKTERIVLEPAALPKLMRLDVSRNEPGRVAPHSLRGDADLFELLRAHQPLLDQLEHLVLPSLPDEPSIGKTAELLSRMPKLVGARVARAYRGTAYQKALDRLARLRVELPVQRPWPHPETLRGGFALVGQTEWGAEEWIAGIDLRDTFDFLERSCHPADYRIWDDVWSWYASVPRRADVAVPRELFERAIAAGGDRLIAELPDWRRLAQALRTDSRPDALVVRRISPRQTGRWRREEA